MERLTVHQRIIAWRLALWPFVQTDDLLHACFGHREDGGPEAAIRMVQKDICLLREKLGIAINTRYATRNRIGYSGGYWVDDRMALLAVLSEEIRLNARPGDGARSARCITGQSTRMDR